MTSVNVNPSNALTVTMTAQWSLVNYVKTFSYTGSSQTWTVPYSGNYKVELWGASGGNAPSTGAYASGQISLSKNANLYAYIGQQGSVYSGESHNTSDESQRTTSSLSYNGGGNYNSGGSGTNGGGATDIRTVSGSWDNANSLRSRIIVAGGGGSGNGGTATAPYGYAGGLTGYEGKSNQQAGMTGLGGSQTAGGGHGTLYNAHSRTAEEIAKATDGAFGIGGKGRGSWLWGAGGGGGWYGGGGSFDVATGGGGSSYISGHTGSVAVTSTSSSSPKSGCTTGTTNNACSITPYINPATGSGYTFTNTLMIDGAGYKWTNAKGSLQTMPNPSGGNYASGVGHEGNGYTRITWMGDAI